MNLVANYFLPPQIKIFVRALLSSIVGFSPVSSWAEGVKKSSGYDTAITAVPIVANTKKMLLDLPGMSHTSSRFQQIATAMMFCLAETRSYESRPYRILDVGGGWGRLLLLFSKIHPGAPIQLDCSRNHNVRTSV
jgi:hypothetical protein